MRVRVGGGGEAEVGRFRDAIQGTSQGAEGGLNEKSRRGSRVELGEIEGAGGRGKMRWRSSQTSQGRGAIEEASRAFEKVGRAESPE